MYLFIDSELKIIEELRSTIETNKLEWKGNKNEMNGRKYSWVLSSLAQEKRPTIVCRMLNTMATKKSYKQANQRYVSVCVAYIKLCAALNQYLCVHSHVLCADCPFINVCVYSYVVSIELVCSLARLHSNVDRPLDKCIGGGISFDSRSHTHSES